MGLIEVLLKCCGVAGTARAGATVWRRSRRLNRAVAAVPPGASKPAALRRRVTRRNVGA